MGEIKIKITKNLICCLQKAIWVFEVSGMGFLRFLDVATIHVLLFGFDSFCCVVVKGNGSLRFLDFAVIHVWS